MLKLVGKKIFKILRIMIKKLFNLNLCIHSSSALKNLVFDLDLHILQMVLAARKPVFGGLRTTQAIPAYASAQSDQRHCYSLFGKYYM